MTNKRAIILVKLQKTMKDKLKKDKQYLNSSKPVLQSIDGKWAIFMGLKILKMNAEAIGLGFDITSFRKALIEKYDRTAFIEGIEKEKEKEFRQKYAKERIKRYGKGSAEFFLELDDNIPEDIKKAKKEQFRRELAELYKLDLDSATWEEIDQARADKYRREFAGLFYSYYNPTHLG